MSINIFEKFNYFISYFIKKEDKEVIFQTIDGDLDHSVIKVQGLIPSSDNCKHCYIYKEEEKWKTTIFCKTCEPFSSNGNQPPGYSNL